MKLDRLCEKSFPIAHGCFDLGAKIYCRRKKHQFWMWIEYLRAGGAFIKFRAHFLFFCPAAYKFDTFNMELTALRRIQFISFIRASRAATGMNLFNENYTQRRKSWPYVQMRQQLVSAGAKQCFSEKKTIVLFLVVFRVSFSCVIVLHFTKQA